MKIFSGSVLILAACVCVAAQVGARREAGGGGLPAGYWSADKSGAIIAKTQTVRLSPDLSHLSEGERRAVAKLLEVGQIFQDVYERQRHADALASRRALAALDRRTNSIPATQNLLALYRLNNGPIATTLDNKREPFLPVELTPPGANVYPWGITKPEVESFLAAHPERKDAILDLRTVVRRATAQNLRADLAVLRQYPVLSTLHPGLQSELTKMQARPD
ncbi:MAG TPA: hypothetical protein VGB76_14260, partial [Pyrinomonadaceae bacterium]